MVTKNKNTNKKSKKIIRPISSIEEIKTIFHKFQDEIKVPGKRNFKNFKKQWKKVIDLDKGNIFLFENVNKIEGAIGVTLNEAQNTKDTVVEEAFLYVMPGQRDKGIGNKLIEYTENWAKDFADMIILTALDNSPNHLENFYKNNGYLPLEKSFYKRL